MENTPFQKQTRKEPLFPELLWSRPENKRLAGKLLVVGGSSHGFSAPAQAYAEAERAGAGIVRVVLPDGLRRTVGKIFEGAVFAPSTPSGSFARLSLGELIEQAAWADGVLLAGDFGRNSETAIALESFASKYEGHLTLAQDAIDYFMEHPQNTLERPNVTLVPTFAQLQKLATAARRTEPFTSTMPLLKFVETLNHFTQELGCNIIVKHEGKIIVSVGGQASATPDDKTDEITLAAHAAVWWLQNPAKPFEALTASLTA